MANELNNPTLEIHTTLPIVRLPGRFYYFGKDGYVHSVQITGGAKETAAKKVRDSKGRFMTGLTRQEVINIIGEKNFEAFDKFMTGQTVGINPDKTIEYYKQDVETFKKIIGGD